MDRILLGKNANGDSGLWVTKAGSNVLMAGIYYGYSEEFEWTGNTYYYGWGQSLIAGGSPTFADPGYVGTTRKRGNWIADSGGVDYRLNATSYGTLQFYANNYDPVIISPNTYSKSFISKDFPIIEMNVRRTSTITPDTPDSGSHAKDLLVYFQVVNSTHNDTGFSGAQSLPLGDYTTFFPDTTTWKTLVWDFSTARDATAATEEASQRASDAWMDESNVKRLRFDFTRNWYTDDPAGPDFEIASIRIKSKSVANNVGPELNPTDFLFSSSELQGHPAGVGTLDDDLPTDVWNYVGLIHQTGIIQAGIAPAWANGDAGPGATSHPEQDAFASPSVANQPTGRVNFPELPYIPYVTFHRYDANTDSNRPENDEDGIPGRMAFPAGPKEYTLKRDAVYKTLAEDPDGMMHWYYAYLQAARTFASARISKDHFDLHIRHAMARESNEWMTNHMIHDVERLTSRQRNSGGGPSSWEYDGEEPVQNKWMIESWRPGWGAYGMSRLDAAFANSSHDFWHDSTKPGNYGTHLWEKGKDHILVPSGTTINTEETWTPIQSANTENIGTPWHNPHGSDVTQGVWPQGSPRALKHFTAYIPHGEPEMVQIYDVVNYFVEFTVLTVSWMPRWMISSEKGAFRGGPRDINTRTHRWYESILDNEMAPLIGVYNREFPSVPYHGWLWIIQSDIANGINYPSGVVPVSNAQYFSNGPRETPRTAQHFPATATAQFWRGNNFPASTGSTGSTSGISDVNDATEWRENRADRNPSHMFSHHNYIANYPENAPYYRYFVYRIPVGID